MTGVVLGVLVTISSVGAGAIGVTVLLLLYPRLPMAIIVGSDIAHAVPLTLVAGIGHWFLGSVDWPLLTSLLTGSVPGIILGSYLSAHVPDAVLRPILAITLVAGRWPAGVLTRVRSGRWVSLRPTHPTISIGPGPAVDLAKCAACRWHTVQGCPTPRD